MFVVVVRSNFLVIRVLFLFKAGCFRAAEAAWWHLVSDEANGGRGIKPEDIVSCTNP